MELWSKHQHLPLLASDTFELPEDVHHLITFLNKTLKCRGLIFGLQRKDNAFVFNIYEHTSQGTSNTK
ncbi:MAG TPA: DUF4264 family protein [Firmicutes bacterium]|nr:DUF4264 family protein [Bacillota bacterium]